MIELAAKISEQGEHRQKTGCVITDRRGRVISTGYCQMKTHPIQAMYAKRCGEERRVYLHAEISALIKCQEDPHTIYIARVINGKKRNAKPCPICTFAIRESGIQRIVYTTASGKVVEESIDEFLSEIC